MEKFFIAANILLLLSLSFHVHGEVEAKLQCDIFKGSWVFDNSYPLYDSTKCPFIEKEFDCQKNGRTDKDYMKFRWQPSGCKLPRFNGVDFLKKLKGKRLMFVGDSLSLNQWQSLTCMLHVAVPEAKYTLERIGGLSKFEFPGYNASIMFFRNAFLVDITSEPNGRVLRLDSISSSKIWGGMDVLIFDSWHWWLHTGRKQPWDWIVHGNSRVKDMDRLSAYEKAMQTWAQWIDLHVDPTKTKVFFQGVSPDHASGQEIGSSRMKNSLNVSNAKTCIGQTQPLRNPRSPHPAEVILEKIIRAMLKPVYLLKITELSDLRIDGHPSVYGSGGHNSIDCSHWCLAGVPDTWNELLYAALVEN
ncbi:Protein trichome birefringence-like 43 [Abeliophyllum distichum]|uniref:Protein trichome birefringence-like 43 n=1 Tax=Abeliophyllum distichum TaxID=126358 RepID=A0ABD1QK82_9LAMI